MTSKPSPTLLTLAEANGAVLTGKPDGSEAITVVFTINAWRSFGAALHAQAVPAGVTPIDMMLHCPKCHMQHVDKPEGSFIPGFTAEESAAWNKAHNLWDNPPHRSHKCAGCGHIWRPADVCTNGVLSVKTEGKADSAPAAVAEHSTNCGEVMSNGRHDELRPTLHGGVAVGGDAHRPMVSGELSSITDKLWNSEEVMSLNAELGLTMDQLVRLATAISTAAVAEPAEPLMTLTNAAKDVLAERRRQSEVEGFDTSHDDEHATGELADAAACYALGVYSERGDAGVPGDIPPYWPWDESWWRPKDRRRNCVRAAALLLAEIDRLDRADGRASRWAAAEPWIA